MPVVTNTLKAPDGSLVSSAAVQIELAGTDGVPIKGYVTAGDYSFIGYHQPTVTNGVWSVTLVANTLINPAGTRWKVSETHNSRTHIYYLSVPDGAGPYFVEDILSEAPGALASAALTTHEADTTSVHGITDTSTLYRSGGTDVAVADGGTGASTAATARTNLGAIAGIRVEDEGTQVIAEAVALNFVGSSVVVTDAGSGEATVTVSAGATVDIRHVEVDALMAEKSHVGFNTFGVDSGRFRNQFRQSGGAQNDEVSWDVYLAAGTHTFTLYGYNGNNRGIMTVQLGGVTVGTVDQYAAAAAPTRTVITGIVVATGGTKTVRLLMASKNASSSNFYGELAGFSFYRTA